MKNLMLDIMINFVCLNLATFIGNYMAGKAFEFNFFFGVVTPILCGVAAWEVKRRKRAR